MKKVSILLIASIILSTAIITAVATYNYVLLNMEIEATTDGYNVIICDNVYKYE